MRERFHEQLMEALAGGRRAEALEAYREVRRRWSTSSGSSPARTCSACTSRSWPATPRSVPPPARDGTRATEPGQQTGGAGRPRQLPAAVPHFTGRAAELGR